MSATRQRRLGNVLMGLGLLAILLGLLARPALGTDEGNFKDANYSVSGSRSYDPNADRTTFSMTLSGNSDPNYTVVLSCPEGKTVVSVSGPPGSTKANNDGGEGHSGQKFTNTTRGPYNVVYRGNVEGAEIMVKNGGGHKHFGVGYGCPSIPTTTSTSTTSTTTTMIPTPTSTTTTTATTIPETTTTTATTIPETTTTTATVDEPVAGRQDAPTTSSTTIPETTTTTATTIPETTTTTATTIPETTTTSTTVDEPAGARAEETTSTSSSATSTTAPAGATTTTIQDTPTTVGTSPEASTTTTGVAQVGGAVRDQTTTTSPNPVNRPAGDGGGSLVEPAVAGADRQRNGTLPVTGTSTSDFLLLAGAALMLGGLAVRFAPPEPRRT